MKKIRDYIDFYDKKLYSYYFLDNGNYVKVEKTKKGFNAYWLMFADHYLFIKNAKSLKQVKKRLKEIENIRWKLKQYV